MKKERLSKPARLVMLDLDGTLYSKGEMIPGAVDAVDRLRQRGLKLAFLTNTDSVPPQAVHQRLIKRGIQVNLEEIVSPPLAVLNFLKRHHDPVVHLVVSDDLIPMFDSYRQSDDAADWVIMGDTSGKISYRKLNTAFRVLDGGASLLTMNKGRSIVKVDGLHLDTGPFVALLEFASRKEARILGKPSVDYMQTVLDQNHVQADECIMVGDDLETDIQGAVNIGCPGILVKTGAYNEDVLRASTIRPFDVIESIASIDDWLDANSP